MTFFTDFCSLDLALRDSLADRACHPGGDTLVCRIGQDAEHDVPDAIDVRTRRAYAFPSEERPDTILILHELCHRAPQTLACQSPPPLESLSVSLILGF